MLATRFGLIVALALGIACRSGRTVPEPGSALVRVACTDGESAPDELRVWVYDDKGRLWNGARIPEQGRLASESPTKLGTVLIAPGPIQGALRIHIRAFAAGTRVADGVLAIPSLSGSERTYDLRLDSPLPADGDGDDVPDEIDDCVDIANPSQGGCPAAAKPDAGDGKSRLADAGKGPVGTREAGTGDMTTPDASGEVDTTVQTGDSPVDAPVIVQGDANPALDTKALVLPDGSASITDSALDAKASSADSNVSVDQVSPRPEAGAADLAIRDTADSRPTALDGPADAPIRTNRANGQVCKAGTECTSGNCRDGVCCNEACNLPCQECGTGTCLPVQRADDNPECTGAMTCNAKGKCVFKLIGS